MNVPMIMSNIFSIIELCLFFCFLYDVEKGYGKVSGYQSAMWVIAVALFVITMAIEILIPKLTVDIEKKLNPEKRGNGTPARLQSGMTCAGKTGTTSENYDLWFCGMTPYYTASIWMGYDSNVDMGGQNTHKYMWRDIMDQIVELEGQDTLCPDG